ncbi:MAG: type II toxin-antitoxin system MqsA family antitoxin [Syntrophobacteraceae bacterium]|nr:type II toxin-antitoxin system MqsA family antitoxin [Syntrophobacteraceae bacterium]
MENLGKCLICGSEHFVFKKTHHHFLESGLDNVHLTNVEIGICSECGEKIVSIPHSTELMKLIAESILLKPANLDGAEIRFLRKNLHLKINEFAQLLGVDRVTVSRWENAHEKPSRSIDRLVRLSYAMEANIPETVMDQLRKNFRKEEADSKVDYFVPIPLAS